MDRPTTEPIVARRIAPDVGRVERDGDKEVPFVFLTVSTVAAPDVIYTLGLREARAMANEILDRTMDAPD
jgi:hypothetical protein